MSDNARDTGQPAGLDRYRLNREISGRGIGTVYEAVDLETGEPVALKAYQPAFATQDEAGWQAAERSEFVDAYEFGLRQFMREADCLRQCSHHSLVTLRHAFEERGGGFWVMELAGGETLADRIDAPSRADEAEVRALMLPLLSALGDLHESGSLHLNLRPQNIAFDPGGQPVLMGFAMARTALYRRLGNEVTRMPPSTYAAIELNTLSEPADPASDIYGLAALLYHVVAGEAPLHATARARHGAMPSVFERAGSAYSEPLLKFIDAGLELHIDDRPTSMGEWGSMLLSTA